MFRHFPDPNGPGSGNGHTHPTAEQRAEAEIAAVLLRYRGTFFQPLSPLSLPRSSIKANDIAKQTVREYRDWCSDVGGPK